MDLNEIRKKIDDIDDKMLASFIERMNLALEVAKYKAANNMPVFQEDREKVILNTIKEHTPIEFRKSAEYLFVNLIDISKTAQVNLITAAEEIPYESVPKRHPTVAVQGIEGSYGYMAAEKLFNDGALSFYAAFREVFEAVESGDADYGIIPIENSTAGEVTANMELLGQHNVYICRTVTVECAHVLAAKKGTSERDLNILLGHEQAIRQCADYISKHKDLTVIPYHNNASAAKTVSENPSGALGCICSAECAEMHGLDIVRRRIASDPNNCTRFICISKDIEVYEGAHTTAVSLSIPNIAGSLYRLLTKFAVNGLFMSKIQSKPLPIDVRLKFPGDYMFYIEFDGSIKDDIVRRLIKNLDEELNYFKFHGSF